MTDSSERDWAAIAQVAFDRSWVRASILLDAQLVVRWASASLEALIGWKPSDVIGHSALEFVHVDDLGVAGDILEFEASLDTWYRESVKQRYVREVRIRCASNEYRMLEIALANFVDDPQLGAIHLDICAPTQYGSLDRALILCREDVPIADVLHLLLEYFTGSETFQPAAAIFDDRGTLLAATKNAPTFDGPLASTSGFRHEWDHDLSEPASGRSLGVFRAWSQLHRPHPLDFEASVRVAQHVTTALIQHRVASELRLAITRDPLTGISNRRAVELAVEQRRARGEQVMLAYVDMNDFKSVNDRLGHAAGDHVLHVIATRLQHLVADGEIAARIGGDEFVVVMNARPTTEELQSRLYALTDEPIFWGSEPLTVDITFGIVIGDASTEDLLAAGSAAVLDRRRERFQEQRRWLASTYWTDNGLHTKGP